MVAADDELPFPAATGLLLGRYERLGVLGRGGMGVVSLARDHGDPAVGLVAIKRIRGADDRAEREALAAARLHHPAIVELRHAEPTDDGWLLVSEYVEGADLRAVLRGGGLGDRDLARIVGSVGRGLAHAHAHGIVHRDVKPANILCPADPRTAGAWAKLTDFGIAALHGAETLTAAGDVVGTMAYMAPEQARGQRAGAPADVFALAVVLFEGLSCVNPRRGDTPAETAARATAGMPPLAEHRPDLPAPVLRAVDSCLHPDPELRGDLAELETALRRLVERGDGSRGGVERRQATDTIVDHRAYRPLPPPPHPPVSPPPRHQRPAPHSSPAQSDPSHQAAVEYGPQPQPAGAQGRGRAPHLPSRLIGVAGAAAAAAVAADAAGVPIAAVAGIAAVAALLLPRLAWVLLAGTVAGLLAQTNETAAALAAIAAVAPLGLLALRPSLWPAGGGAAGLATLGVPAAWPAFAALAPSPALRAGLAAQGALVVSVAAVAVDVPALLIPPGDFAQVLTAFTLPLAVIWVIAALLFPVLVRGRALAGDLLAAAAWTGALGGALAGAQLVTAGPLPWVAPGAVALAGVLANLRAPAGV